MTMTALKALTKHNKAREQMQRKYSQAPQAPPPYVPQGPPPPFFYPLPHFPGALPYSTHLPPPPMFPPQQTQPQGQQQQQGGGGRGGGSEGGSSGGGGDGAGPSGNNNADEHIRKCGQHQPLSATVVAFDTPNTITSQNKEYKEWAVDSSKEDIHICKGGVHHPRSAHVVDSSTPHVILKQDKEYKGGCEKTLTRGVSHRLRACNTTQHARLQLSRRKTRAAGTRTQQTI
jgi:hypothetical protein